MLPQLRDLDPCERPERPATRAELDPGDLRVALPTDPPKEASSLSEEPALGPRRIAAEGIGGRPGIGRGIAVGPPAEVGPASRRPPRPIVVRVDELGRRGHHRNAPAMLRDAMRGHMWLGTAA